MITERLLRMMAEFLRGDYDPQDFSFDFPDALLGEYAALESEHPGLGDLLSEDMPEICAYFDPYATGDPDTIDEGEFRARVQGVYDAALRIMEGQRKAM